MRHVILVKLSPGQWIRDDSTLRHCCDTPLLHYKLMCLIKMTTSFMYPHYSVLFSHTSFRLNDTSFHTNTTCTGSIQPHFHLHVERGSSVGRMPDSQSREPGFESPLLPFRSLGIFFHFTTPQSTQLYK